MEPRFKCPSCHAKMKADRELGGQDVECPRCGHLVLVPKVSFHEGEVIAGFQLSSWIGSGSMGEVYRAKQLSMDRDVAIKLLRPDLIEDQEHIDRFNNEVRMLAKLDHPNIVTAFEAGQHGNHYFLAMTFVSGYNLDECLLERGRLPEREIAKVVLKVAKALAYAWERFQILHRDIKPSNIMIDTDGEVKLTDVGIAKRVDDELDPAQAGFVLGTPYYMSPEQASAKTDLDFRADMFSLGSTFYHLVTGKAPFDGETPTEIMLKVIHDPPPDPCQLNPEISADCGRILRRMMAKKPADRYPSWQALIDDLQAAIRGDSEVLLKESESAAAGRLARSKKALTAKPPKRRLVVPAATPATAPRRSWFLPVMATLIGLGLIAVVIWQVLDNADRPTVPDEPVPPPIAKVVLDPPPADLPPVKPADPTPRRDVAAEFRAAQRFFDENPVAFAEAMRRFEAVAGAGDSEYHRQASQAIARIRQEQAALVALKQEELAKEAAQYAHGGDYQRAIRYLEEYDGKFAAETRAFREERMAAYRRQLETQATAQRDARGESRRLWRETAAQVADDLLRNNAVSAFNKLTEARRNEAMSFAREEIDEALARVQGLGRWRHLVLQTFEAQKGQTIKVQLKSGAKHLLIREIAEDGVIKTFETVEAGRFGRNLTVDDLAGDELATRLAAAKVPGAELALAIFYLGNGQAERAAQIYAELPGALGEGLLRRLYDQAPAAVDAVARQALVGLLRDAGYPPAGGAQETLAAIEANPPDREQLARLRRPVVDFAGRFGYTETAAEWQTVLRRLRGEAVDGWPVNRAGLVFYWRARGDERFGLRDPQTGAWRLCRLDAKEPSSLAADNTLNCAGEGWLEATGTPVSLLKACQASNAFGMEILLTPDPLTQSGPARIVSFSADPNARNFTLGQEATRLIFRLRTTDNGPNGANHEIALIDLERVELPCHLVLSYRDGVTRWLVNGEAIAQTDAVTGDFRTWELQRLIFGNEATGDRGWRGQIHRIALYSRAIEDAEAKAMYQLAKPGR